MLKVRRRLGRPRGQVQLRADALHDPLVDPLQDPLFDPLSAPEPPAVYTRFRAMV